MIVVSPIISIPNSLSIVNSIFPSTIEDIIRQNKLITGISIVSMPNAKERHVPVAYLTIESDLIGHEEELIDNIESSIKERLPEFNIPAKYIFNQKSKKFIFFLLIL